MHVAQNQSAKLFFGKALDDDIFPSPSFAILAIRTTSPIEQLVDEIIGCEEEVRGYTDLCVEGVEEQNIESLRFTIFHEPGPVYGSYHHITKKGDVLLDIQTFLPPNEDPLNVQEILKSLRWF